jgi:hypothetical protein
MALTTVALVLGGFTLACSDKADFSQARDAHHFFARLALTPHAVNMATVAPYDTVQLHADALAQDNTPIVGPVNFTSSDSNSVVVSPTGLLTAKGVTSSTIIRASFTYDGITRIDSTIVTVTNAVLPSPLQRLVIVVNPGDSAKVSAGSLSGRNKKSFRVAPIETSGDTASSLLFAVWSSDTTTAKVTRSNMTIAITAVKPGRVMLHVSTLAYGVVQYDSLAFVVGWPLSYMARIYSRFATGTRDRIFDFNPGTFTIGVGGSALWANTTDTIPIDIVFDQPEAAHALTGTEALYGGTGTGNVPPFSSKDKFGIVPGIVGRSFNQPGRYPYHSTLYGTGGVIIVCAESDPSCYPF